MLQGNMAGPVSLANEGFKESILRHSCILCGLSGVQILLQQG